MTDRPQFIPSDACIAVSELLEPRAASTNVKMPAVPS
jgi:hypothetical protein